MRRDAPRNKKCGTVPKDGAAFTKTIDSRTLRGRGSNPAAATMVRKKKAAVPKTKAALLATALSGRCPSNAAVVEPAGIEPASIGDLPGLLRAEPVFAFLGPGSLTGTLLTGPAT